MSIDALKIESTISGTFITARIPFTITTTITNAHDEPVEIMEYFYHIPYQVQWIHDKIYMQAYAEIHKLNPLARLFAMCPWKTASSPPGENMYYRAEAQNKPLQTIQEGETSSYSFKAIVPKWLFTIGREIKFEGLISYRYKKEMHTSKFSVGFAVRPPLSSNIIGAIWGGILGTVAKYLQNITTFSITEPTFSFICASALAMILGVIIVVFSSRRTADIQPILTIEDIWGGILAGFFVGYLGHEFFSQVIPGIKS